MNRDPVYRALAFLFPFVVLLLVSVNQPNLLGLWEDDGLYFQGAQGLAQGKGYRTLFFPGEPHQTRYPPLYSLSLAFFMSLGLIKSSDALQIALPNILFLSLASLVFFNLFRGRFPELKSGTGLLVTWLVFLHPHLWSVVFLPMSEPLFILLYLLILWILDTYRGSEDAPGFWLGIGCLLGLSLLTRTLSFSLAMGATLWLLAQRRVGWSRRLRHAFVLLAPILALYGIWELWTRYSYSHNPPTANSILFTYFKVYSIRDSQLLSFLPSVVVSNVNLAFESAAGLIPYALITPLTLLQNKSLMLLFGFVFVGVFLAGIHAGIQKRGLRPEHLMFPLYLAVIVAWPFNPWRFVIALIPWIALIFADAFDWLRERGKAVVFPLVLVLCIQGIGAGRFYVAVAGQTISSFEFMGIPFDFTLTQETLKWMSDHLPEGAVVGSAKSQMVYFHAHRKSVPPLDASKMAPLYYPHTVEWVWSGHLGAENIAFIQKDQENIWQAWRDIGVTHVFFDATDRGDVASLANALLIKSHLSQMIRVHSTPMTAVFEIRW